MINWKWKMPTYLRLQVGGAKAARSFKGPAIKAVVQHLSGNIEAWMWTYTRTALPAHKA